MRLLCLAFVLIFSSFSYSASADMTDPNQVIHSVSTQTLDRIRIEKSRLEKEPLFIQQIMEEELLPYFDYKYAAFKVMGVHLKKTTKEQRNNFVAAFKNYLINTYGHILLNYNQHKFEIVDNPNFKDKKIIAINTRVSSLVEPDKITKLAFTLRKNKKTGEWKVYDVLAEGISMLNTKQSELGELIRKNGIDEVIELLKQKNQEFSS